MAERAARTIARLFGERVKVVADHTAFRRRGARGRVPCGRPAPGTCSSWVESKPTPLALIGGSWRILADGWPRLSARGPHPGGRAKEKPHDRMGELVERTGGRSRFLKRLER